MNLIAYSDSEESDNEAPQAPKPVAKPASKPAFQKVVDRSNPGKIKLQLPTPSQPRAAQDDIEADAPPAKKARTGQGAFSGFNSMLPAPKKPDVTAAPAAAPPGKRGLGKSLGVGVNLRTGAEPAFQRANKEEDYDEDGNPIKRKDATPLQKEDFRAMLNLPPPKTQAKEEVKPDFIPHVTPAVQPEVKPAVKQPTFMPLSVARGLKKKKPMKPRPSAVSEGINTAPASQVKALATETKPPAKPKVSLFSVPQEEDVLPTNASSNGDYQPLIYGAHDDNDAQLPDEAFNEPTYYETTTQYHSASASTRGAHENLTNIASELHLNESERRQLFGRKGQGPDFSAAKFVEFNTDAEYAHNEKLRQQGETVQHNALRSINAAGKNSLKSLVNVASTQKEALEEHFAAGKRNKKEAGSKYGW